MKKLSQKGVWAHCGDGGAHSHPGGVAAGVVHKAGALCAVGGARCSRRSASLIVLYIVRKDDNPAYKIV